MILPGTNLPDICRPIWGRSWVAGLAKHIGVSVRTIQRLRKSKAGVSVIIQRDLVSAIDGQIKEAESRITALRAVRARLTATAGEGF